MRKKVSILYQINELKNSIITLYVIVICIMALTIILPWGKFDPSFDYYNSKFNGLEIITAIFLFIKGTHFFKNDFKMLMQNSVSRKSIFISKCYVIFIVGFAMSIIGNLILVIGNMIPNKNSINIFQGIYDMLFHQRVMQYSDFRIFFESLLFSFVFYLFFYCFGYLFIVIKNQMSRKLKIILITAISSFFIIILPFINALSNNKINDILLRSLNIALGISSGNSFALMLTLITIMIISFCIIYYYIQRAVFGD